jgi:hypothetical protein
MACMATNHMYMTLYHIEQVEDESKEYKPVDIYMDNRSTVEMNITFKDNKNITHIMNIPHFAKQ